MQQSQSEISKIKNEKIDPRVSTLRNFIDPAGYTILILPKLPPNYKVNPGLREKLKYDSDQDIIAVWLQRRIKRIKK